MSINKPYAPPPFPRQRVLVSQGDRIAGADLPLDGESSNFDHIDNFFRTMLLSMDRTYAPRRMLKIGHPDEELGLYLPARAGSEVSVAVRSSLFLFAKAQIPLLICRWVDVTEEDQDEWFAPNLAAPNPGYIDQPQVVPVPGHIELAYRSPLLDDDPQDAGFSTLRFKNYYSKDVYIRGAIYFPLVSNETLAGRLRRVV